jgi:hypothetical protein
LLSEEFLVEVRAMKEQNLAVEALSRLLKSEVKSRFKTNVAKNSKYSELLEGALAKYRNRSIETAQLIEELIDLAKLLNEEVKQGNPDGLTDDEISFYDALEENEAAVREMKHETLVQLAQELGVHLREDLARILGEVGIDVFARLRRRLEIRPDDVGIASRCGSRIYRAQTAEPARLERVRLVFLRPELRKHEERGKIHGDALADVFVVGDVVGIRHPRPRGSWIARPV